MAAPSRTILAIAVVLVLSTLIPLASAARPQPAPAGTEAAGSLVLATPMDLALAMAADPAVVVGAEFVELPPYGQPAAVSNEAVPGFPRADDSFAVLGSGSAQAKKSGWFNEDNGGSGVRGANVYDVVVLRIDLDVPEDADCLRFDFRFVTDEYPDYVGTEFNDAFVAELDVTSWTHDQWDLVAPDNFAVDQLGNPITIYDAGVQTMSANHASGTGYGGGTTVLRAATPVTPGPHSLYLSIFDVTDMAYDSTVFLDNLVVETAAPGECLTGVDLVDPLTLSAVTTQPVYAPHEVPVLEVEASWLAAGAAGGVALTVTVEYVPPHPLLATVLRPCRQTFDAGETDAEGRATIDLPRSLLARCASGPDAAEMPSLGGHFVVTVRGHDGDSHAYTTTTYEVGA